MIQDGTQDFYNQQAELARQYRLQRPPTTMSATEKIATSAQPQSDGDGIHQEDGPPGAGGVSGPLMGRASLSANAGDPVAWQYRSLPDVGGVWFDCTKERADLRAARPEIWEVRALYAAPPTAQALGCGAEPPGIQALMCVISSLRDIAHFSDEEGGELMSALCVLRDWAYAQTAAFQPPPTSAEGVEP